MKSGTILLGIHDSGHVRGMPLTLGQMDHLKGSISDILNRFSPPCPQNLVKVKFVPVLRQQTDDYQTNSETWYKKERFQ